MLAWIRGLLLPFERVLRRTAGSFRYPVSLVVDDATLLERWRTGDAAAGQELLRRHFRSIYAFFANKVSGPPDDLIQETFRACVEARGRIREGSSFRAYLLTIAPGTVSDVPRASHRRTLRPESHLRGATRQLSHCADR